MAITLPNCAAWGLIGYVLGASAFRSAIWGAVLAVGFSDLARGAKRVPVEVVLHAVPAVLWFLILWPLAYLNHRLLARELSSGAGVR